MKNLGIPITLDRPRTLLIDERALLLFHQTFAAPIDARSMVEQPMTLDFVRKIIWAGCADQHQRFSFTTVCQVITKENHEQFHEAIVKAICRGLNIAYKPEH